MLITCCTLTLCVCMMDVEPDEEDEYEEVLKPYSVLLTHTLSSNLLGDSSSGAERSPKPRHDHPVPRNMCYTCKTVIALHEEFSL